MSIESISSVGKSSIQPAGDSIPYENPFAFKEKGYDQGENASDLSRMREVAMDLQNKLKVFHNVNLDFSVHQASGQIMVTVTDQDTGKLIREIPPREMLNLTTKLEEMIGIIFDQEI